MEVPYSKIRAFRKEVFEHYRTHGRSFPWRETRDPYKILVSEYMLQQTQTERVVLKYEAFLKQFPTAEVLSKASTKEVLRLWQGLGYNRRALNLKRAADALVALGSFPHTAEALEKLPGVGPYTARAVLIFAFNRDEVCIETNIRSAVLHYFFPKAGKVPDADIIPYLRSALPKGRSGEWHHALMDYGAMLKKNGPNPSRRSTHHSRQSKFKGSRRELRGEILKAHLNTPQRFSIKAFSKKTGRGEAEIKEVLHDLKREGLVDV